MKEQDIRPADLFETYLELSARDAHTFFSDRARFQDVACPGCGHAAAAEAFTKEGFRYVECRACGTLFVSPRPDREALDRFYGDSPSATYWADTFFPASMANRREQIFAPRVTRVLDVLEGREPRTIVDVGAGYGLFLEEYRRQRPDVRLLAVEPGQKLAEVCRGKGFETLEVPVEDAGAWAGVADLAVCFEVLEHVYSPIEFVRSMARLLAPGGRLLVSSLGVEGFDIQVLWDRSRSVSPPHHLNFPSVEGFTRLFERAGLVDVTVLTPGRLDVDIVRNAVAADPSIAADNRFVRLLLDRRSGAVHDAFQQFLAAHALSSHVWVLASRPEAA
jgi:SAM-dependent methyltransferase